MHACFHSFHINYLCKIVWNCCMHNKCMSLYRNFTRYRICLVLWAPFSLKTLLGEASCGSQTFSANSRVCGKISSYKIISAARYMLAFDWAQKYFLCPITHKHSNNWFVKSSILGALLPVTSWKLSPLFFLIQLTGPKSPRMMRSVLGKLRLISDEICLPDSLRLIRTYKWPYWFAFFF